MNYDVMKVKYLKEKTRFDVYRNKSRVYPLFREIYLIFLSPNLEVNIIKKLF